MPNAVRVRVRAAAALAAYLASTSAVLACKDRLYPGSFPVDELAGYDSVYVVRVLSVSPSEPVSEGSSAPPFSFEARVLQTLKGSKAPGNTIRGATSSRDEPAARCPIQLEAGRAYLLMLTGSDDPFVLPRYGSLYVSSDDEHFQHYVENIKSYYSLTR